MENLNKQREEAWEQNYRLLCQFIEAYERLPKVRECYKGKAIGSWLSYQKSACKKENYPSEHKKLLESIYAAGTVSFLDARWEYNYQLLRQFIKEYGRLPKQREVYMGEKIGCWLGLQREAIKKENYPIDRRIKLEAANVKHSVSSKEKWDKRYQLLSQFIEEYDCLPKRNVIYHGVNIGKWLSYHKSACKKEYYPVEQREKIEEVYVRYPCKSWEWHYKVLCQFVEHNNRLPKTNETYLDDKIGFWLANQREKLRTENYPLEHKEKLERVGVFARDTFDERWEKKYQLLCRFIEEYNRIPKHREMYGAYDIGLWLWKQQQNIKRPSYPVERKQKIKSILSSTISMWDKKWEDNYQLLCRFAEKYGRLPLSKECYLDNKIGQWYTSQKRQCKQEDYPEYRKKKIAELNDKFAETATK